MAVMAFLGEALCFVEVAGWGGIGFLDLLLFAPCFLLRSCNVKEILVLALGELKFLQDLLVLLLLFCFRMRVFW